MKKFIIVALLVALSLTFTLKDFNLGVKHREVEGSSGAESLTACSSNETNALYNAISTCEMSSESNTLDCINNKLLTNIGERWNLFAKRSTAFAGVAFWLYNNCSINLNNYGPYSRAYTAWPSQLYNSSLTADSNCTIARNQTVLTAIRGCEMYDETNSARCIINALKTSVNEYWNAYVASSSSSAAVKYWFFDNCTVTFNNYGQYNRTYTAWKAY